MMEPTYLRSSGPIPLSQCSPAELNEVVMGQVVFVPTEGDRDLSFGLHYAAKLLAEKLK